ncbi:MAG: nicotinamide-nucleotide amidohydrolase family protein [Candidatus Thiodiazotropha sp.]
MADSDVPLQALAQGCAERLLSRDQRLVVAESCTGGWLAKVLTDLPGSSQWFERGYVTYSDCSKQEMLGVSAEILEQRGAVSEQTVEAMVRGALEKSGADLAVAISGIAGPGGGSEEKPVGTVCFAWEMRGRAPQSERRYFPGDREAVRRQATGYAMQQLIGILESE